MRNLNSFLHILLRFLCTYPLKSSSFHIKQVLWNNIPSSFKTESVISRQLLFTPVDRLWFITFVKFWFEWSLYEFHVLSLSLQYIEEKVVSGVFIKSGVIRIIFIGSKRPLRLKCNPFICFGSFLIMTITLLQ